MGQRQTKCEVGKLPNELLRQILAMVEEDDWFSILRVCKKWNTEGLTVFGSKLLKYHITKCLEIAELRSVDNERKGVLLIGRGRSDRVYKRMLQRIRHAVNV